jgi:hypothetical protein
MKAKPILVWTQHLASAISRLSVDRAILADEPLETNIEVFEQQQAAISIVLYGSEILLIHKQQSGGSSRPIVVS